MSAGKKRALIVLDCGLRWPTGMVRAMQFEPMFQRSDTWHAEFVSRHPEHIVRLLYHSGNSLGWRIFIRVVRPILTAYYDYWSNKQDKHIVKLASSVDVVCIVKSPSLPLYRRLVRLCGPRILMDINDSLWLQKNGDWKELDEMLTEVHGVICECEYVAKYARRFNSNVVVISDAPQLEVFDRYRSEVRRDPEQIVLGWVGGGHNTGPLFKLLEPLEALFARHPSLRLRVVGADPSRLPPFEKVLVSCLPTYSQEDMVREVLGFDIGLFPLFRNDDGRGRGTLKAKIYMSGEAVAVCENYGENPGLIKDGINGVLVSSPEEWYERLEWLITHREERIALARRGLEHIRSEFSARHVFARILATYELALDSSLATTSTADVHPATN